MDIVSIKKVSELVSWLDTFYRPQLEQAMRAQRTQTEWSASDGQRVYYTLAELDIEANNKQLQIRTLKAQLQNQEG